MGGYVMTDSEQKNAAKQFVKDWTGKGFEKQEIQRFWIALLQNVFGVEQATNAIEFEVPVQLSHTSFIDGYIKDTHVLIEQKGADIDAISKAMAPCLPPTNRHAVMPVICPIT